MVLFHTRMLIPSMVLRSDLMIQEIKEIVTGGTKEGDPNLTIRTIHHSLIPLTVGTMIKIDTEVSVEAEAAVMTGAKRVEARAVMVIVGGGVVDTNQEVEAEAAIPDDIVEIGRA